MNLAVTTSWRLLDESSVKKALDAENVKNAREVCITHLAGALSARRVAGTAWSFDVLGVNGDFSGGFCDGNVDGHFLGDAGEKVVDSQAAFS